MDEVLVIAAQLNVIDYLVLDWNWNGEQGKVHDDLVEYSSELRNELDIALAKELEKRTIAIARPSKEYKNDRSFDYDNRKL